MTVGRTVRDTTSCGDRPTGRYGGHGGRGVTTPTSYLWDTGDVPGDRTSSHPDPPGPSWRDVEGIYDPCLQSGTLESHSLFVAIGSRLPISLHPDLSLRPRCDGLPLLCKVLVLGGCSNIYKNTGVI